MATETLARLEQALKTYYMGPITKQLDEGSGPVYAAITKGQKYIVGNKFKFPMEYGRSGGIGARAEDGSLPTPSSRKYKQGEAESKNLYARFAITDKLMRTSKDSKASFASQVDEQMQNLVADGKDMLRRNLINTSDGVMATVNGAVTSSKNIIIDGGSIYAFYPGQFIDAGTVSSGTFTATISNKEIADVDYDNNKLIMVDTITSLADNAVIVLTGNYGNEMTGIEDIFTKTTLYGVDRSTNHWFMPTVITKNTSDDFDSMWIQEALDAIETKTGGKPNFITCSYGVQRAYIDEQNSLKRNLEYNTVHGGYKLVSYNNTAFSPEKYMKSNTLDLIDTSWLYLGRLADWEWMSEDGAILHRVADKAAYEGSLVMYGELLCLKPAAHARLKGLKEV